MKLIIKNNLVKLPSNIRHKFRHLVYVKILNRGRLNPFIICLCCMQFQSIIALHAGKVTIKSTCCICHFIQDKKGFGQPK